MEYKVKIDAFEGPLDLLLHLIKKLEIDIYDIPVAKITEQYLEFIHDMQVLQLDVASEYLVMAASLIEMKSRMLLPKQDPLDMDIEGEEYEEVDPREELTRRLIEYRMYKEAAERLKEKEESRQLVFTKAPHDLSAFKSEDPRFVVQNGSVYEMLAAYRHLMRRKEANRPLHTKIQRQELPIRPRMTAIVHRLRQTRKPMPFDALFSYPNRTHLVVTFLAMLELMRHGEITCTQNQNFARIMVYLMEGGPRVDIE